MLCMPNWQLKWCYHKHTNSVCLFVIGLTLTFSPYFSLSLSPSPYLPSLTLKKKKSCSTERTTVSKCLLCQFWDLAKWSRASILFTFQMIGYILYVRIFCQVTHKYHFRNPPWHPPYLPLYLIGCVGICGGVPSTPLKANDVRDVKFSLFNDHRLSTNHTALKPPSYSTCCNWHANVFLITLVEGISCPSPPLC